MTDGRSDLEMGTDFVLYPKEALLAALDALPCETQAVLRSTAERIHAFAACQRASIQDISRNVPGGRCGLRYQPVTPRAGCYAPGGRFPLPSSVLMTACTARCLRRCCGGVGGISTSPTHHARRSCGCWCRWCLGGWRCAGDCCTRVWFDDFNPCDIVVGPGNRWVTAAKKLVSGDVAIDMLAGPSELLVIADKTADPNRVAADLLAQAEHDPDAVPTLIALEDGVIAEVERALTEQLATLPTAEIAGAALGNGWATTADAAAAISIANRLAPEHLSIQTKDATRMATRNHTIWRAIRWLGCGRSLGRLWRGAESYLANGGQCAPLVRCLRWTSCAPKLGCALRMNNPVSPWYRIPSAWHD